MIGGQIREADARRLILKKIYEVARAELDRYLNVEKRAFVRGVENLWEKYAISADELEACSSDHARHDGRFPKGIGVPGMTLPDGWKQGRLGELCSIEIGGTPPRGVEAYWDSAHDTSNVWVSIRDMHQSLVTGSAEQISDLGIMKSNVKLQQPGTVLLSFKLSIGRVAIAAVPLFTNEAIAGLSPTGLTRDFLFHGLQGWDLLQGVDQAVKGATLNKKKLNKFLFEYPESECEQAKIADVLSTVDRAVEKTEALIAKKQRIKTGLMQGLLTRGIDEHGNLRSEQTHEFKDSPLGADPGRVDCELDRCGV